MTTNPADEIRAAATALRPSSPSVAAHTVAVRLAPAVADLLADWLDLEAAHRAAVDVGQPLGERDAAALALARAINGGTQ